MDHPRYIVHREVVKKRFVITKVRSNGVKIHGNFQENATSRYQGQVRCGAYAARGRVHLVTVLLQPPSGHRPWSRRVRF